MSNERPEITDRWRHATAWWSNTFLMLAIIVFLTFARFDDGRFSFDWWPVTPWGAVMLTCVLLAVFARTRFPWLFFVVASLPNLLFAYGMQPPYSMLGLLLALAFAVYAVTATVRFAIGAAAVGSIWLIFIVGSVVSRGMSFAHLFPGTLTAGLALALAVGQATYARRRLMEAAHRRATQAEQTREALAATRVAENRLATARDLHDVVGHEIAVINLQAGVAQEAVRRDPDTALASLTAIQTSAQAILGEIAELLRDLRAASAGDEPEIDRGVSEFPSMARTFTAAGAPVDLWIAHDLPQLPAEVDSAAYRILEESLVNAYKHGKPGGHAEVRVTATPQHLVLEMSNPVAELDARGPSTGLGVLGIEERARALGGAATVSVEDGVYRLNVHLPVSRS